MQKTLYSLLICMIPAYAYGFDFRSDKFELDDISEISIRVWDNASEGCWTSIRSSKAYLGDKFDAVGIDVVEEAADRVLIDVNSSRTQSTYLLGRWREGSCFGSVRIALYKKEPPLDSNQPLNIFVSRDATFTGHPNANEVVFQMLDSFMQDVRK